MDNNSIKEGNGNTLLEQLDTFWKRLETMDNNIEQPVMQAFNEELQLFLEAYSGREEDGFLESLKQYNRTGSWRNLDFLRMVLLHYKSKWGKVH